MADFKKIYHALSRHWLTIGFLLGFITDVILLNRVDDVVDNLILLFYTTLATTSFLLFYVGVAEKVSPAVANFLRRYSPMAMQYAFGGLLSGMLIFYGRSGDWVSGAPFLILILAVIIGNEMVNKRSERLVYHVVVYFIGLFSYSVFVLPVLTGYMGDWVFVASGFLALSIVGLFLKVLHYIVPRFIEMNIRNLIIAVATVYGSFNLLYFTSVIPPIPLSLTELSVVQFVEKIPRQETYRIIYEEQSWYQDLPFVKPSIHPTRGAVYCFSRVYMPAKLQTEVYHRWEYKDQTTGKWRQSFRFGYPVEGTNRYGYRGYTKLEHFFDGTWRCSVETKRGQVLGRKTVVIDTKSPARELTTVIE
jgi:hypothetical protein